MLGSPFPLPEALSSLLPSSLTVSAFRDFPQVHHAVTGVSPNHAGDCQPFRLQFIFVSQALMKVQCARDLHYQISLKRFP